MTWVVLVLFWSGGSAPLVMDSHLHYGSPEACNAEAARVRRDFADLTSGARDYGRHVVRCVKVGELVTRSPEPEAAK